MDNVFPQKITQVLITNLEEILAFSSVSLEVLVMVNSSFAFCIKLICCNEKYLSHTCSLKRSRNGCVSAELHVLRVSMKCLW